jgi:crotonobetainyl-CoA:carnitine CoA-transferase CaiB-like acyl-CoA transferase
MPLSDITVIDLSRMLAGPFCAGMLADLGADVIKVESPDGDMLRSQGAGRDGLSWYFAQINRNKRSIVLDLYTDEAKAVLTDLLAGADVLVENFRPGVLARMGFGPERLAEINPRLVLTSINGFGSTGPYVDRPAFDFIAQAMSGFMSLQGEPDRPPLRSGLPLADLLAGMYAAFGTVSALLGRGRLGKGQQVETSLTNSLVSLFTYASASYFATGAPPARTGNDHPIVAPYGLFQASDGEIAVAPSTEAMVAKFLATLGLADLLQQPDYATNAARMANRVPLNALVNARTAERPVDDWIAALNAAGVPCGRVQQLADVFADPQILAQQMVIDVPHPGHGTVRMTGFPVKLSDTPARIRHPAPDLGAQTDEVLRGLGYTDDRIAALRRAGALGGADKHEERTA